MFVEHKEIGEAKELDDASKLLLRAADIIECKGLWCGDGQNVGGRCILTALIEAEGRTAALGPTGDAAFDMVTDALGLRSLSEHENRSRRIYAWNDSHRKEEVVAKLRAVALGG